MRRGLRWFTNQTVEHTARAAEMIASHTRARPSEDASTAGRAITGWLIPTVCSLASRPFFYIGTAAMLIAIMTVAFRPQTVAEQKTLSKVVPGPSSPPRPLHTWMSA